MRKGSNGVQVNPSDRSLPDALVHVAQMAGEEILRWYGAPGTVQRKSDDSPLTQADQAAHRCIVSALGRLTPGLPVLSEESAESEISERRSWRRYWLVDPLDGTKEFLKQTGEFTVNVALVEDGRPTMGVVHAPSLGRTYRAAPGLGAQVAGAEGSFVPIHTRWFQEDAPVLVASRDHAGPGVEALAQALGQRVRFTSMGSSLKFCLVAEGKADLYLRDLPTMEWDTGAAQCVLEHAGGAVFALNRDGRASGDIGAGVLRYLRDAESLQYNRDSLKNPPFLAAGDPEGTWRELVRGRIDDDVGPGT